MAAAELQPAYHHVKELRNRLSLCVVVFLVGAVLGYLVRSPIIQYLERPLGRELFYTSPMGSFEFVMRICFVVGLVVALPVLLFHLLRFIEPALPMPLTRRFLIGGIGASWSLAIGGVLFGYYVSLPTALHFLGHVGTGDLQAIITADKYFAFLSSYLGIFAVVFQLPLILLFVNRITPLGPTQLRRWRKYVIVGSFVVALITPAPDPVSQTIMAAPIIVLYELSIGLVALLNRRRPRVEAVPDPVLPPSQPQSQTQQPRLQPVPKPRPTVQRPRPTLDLRNAPVLSPRRPAVAESNTLDLRSLSTP